MTNGVKPSRFAQIPAISACYILHSAFLTGALELVLFAPVMLFDISIQFYQRILYRLDEIPTTGREPTHIDDRVALRGIIGHRQHFTVRLKPNRRAFNHLVGSLAGA